MRPVLTIIALLFVVFILPALAHVGVWLVKDRPASWRSADWSSAGLLPAPSTDESGVWLMSARTGGLKGALATHSWIVTKAAGTTRYERYDKMGWGRPIRRNVQVADGRWYSNEPKVVWSVTGEKAERLIAPIEAAIRDYPWSKPGDYHIWPGPNSNSFIAHVINSVPGFGSALPAEAVGRDFPTDGGWWWRDAQGTLHATLGGYAGFAVGSAVGLEFNFIGLVVGLNPKRGEVKLPGFGTMRPFSA
ncbi:DUF3750 domain-containing protein [Rhizobiaceae bacterium]|nr:DUF3750 domain-containing protein [Rhizobiaceae bacterium]